MEASDYPRQRVLEPEKNRADRLSAERWEDMVYDRGPGPGSGDNARYRHGRKVLTYASSDHRIWDAGLLRDHKLRVVCAQRYMHHIIRLASNYELEVVCCTAVHGNG